MSQFKRRTREEEELMDISPPSAPHPPPPSAPHLLDLTAGGALWFCDLSVPDPTWILPVLLGLTNLLAVEVSGPPGTLPHTPLQPLPHPLPSISLLLQVFSLQRLSEPTRLQRIMTNGFRTFSLLMVPIAASVPAVRTTRGLSGVLS